MASHPEKIEMLEPDSCALLLVDYQSQMLFGVKSRDRDVVINNVVALTHTAETFNVPIVVSTLAADTLNGPLFMDLKAVLPPEVQTIDRTALNPWESAAFQSAVKKVKRGKLLIGALWSHVSLTYTTLGALVEGYQAYPVIDTSGAPTIEAHEMAVQRMLISGAIPVSWQQVMFEFQRDWANTRTADRVHEITRHYFGAFSQGIVHPQLLTGEKGRAGMRPGAGERSH